MTGINVFIGIKWISKGSEKRAKPKPVVPFIMPETKTILNMMIQSAVPIKSEYAIKVFNPGRTRIVSSQPVLL